MVVKPFLCSSILEERFPLKTFNHLVSILLVFTCVDAADVLFSGAFCFVVVVFFFLPNLPCSNSCLDDFSGLDLSGATRLRRQASDVFFVSFNLKPHTHTHNLLPSLCATLVTPCLCPSLSSAWFHFSFFTCWTLPQHFFFVLCMQDAFLGSGFTLACFLFCFVFVCFHSCSFLFVFVLCAEIVLFEKIQCSYHVLTDQRQCLNSPTGPKCVTVKKQKDFGCKIWDLLEIVWFGNIFKRPVLFSLFILPVRSYNMSSCIFPLWFENVVAVSDQHKRSSSWEMQNFALLCSSRLRTFCFQTGCNL